MVISSCSVRTTPNSSFTLAGGTGSNAGINYETNHKSGAALLRASTLRLSSRSWCKLLIVGCQSIRKHYYIQDRPMLDCLGFRDFSYF